MLKAVANELPSRFEIVKETAEVIVATTGRWHGCTAQLYIIHFHTFMRQNGCHFADHILKCILLNENVWISIKFALKFIHNGQINNIPALAPIMAWRRPGDKPLSEPMMASLLTHICVTRPQWVNKLEEANATNHVLVKTYTAPRQRYLYNCHKEELIRLCNV